MKDYSKIFKQAEELRFQKKSYEKIEKILRLKNGHPREDVLHVVTNLKNKEDKDYQILVNEVDDLNYRANFIGNIVWGILGIILLCLGIYFSYYFYKVFNTPSTLIKEKVIIKFDKMWKGRLSIYLFIFAFGSFLAAVSMLSGGLKSFKKLKKNRERFLFIKERL